MPHPEPLFNWAQGPCPVGHHHLSFRPTALPKPVSQVLGLALIILCTSSVSVALWRIQRGTPQAPEFLIHPTVWLTTMVRMTQACGSCFWQWLSPPPRWRGWGRAGLPFSLPTFRGPSQLSCPELRHVPDPHGEEEGGPGIRCAVWILAALFSPAGYQCRSADLARGKWRPRGNQ